MKHFIITLLAILFSSACLSAQESVDTIAPTTADTTTVFTADTEQAAAPIVAADWYKDTVQWKRYKRLRKWGWTCLGVGLGGYISMYALFIAAWTDAWPNNTFGHILDAITVGSVVTFYYLGPVLMLASIPLLATAYTYRYKARHLKVGLTAMSDLRTSQRLAATPGVSLSLTF